MESVNHVAIVLRSDNPSDFANNPLFKGTGGKEATLGGQAFGKGKGIFGNLRSAPNYEGDNPSKLNDLTEIKRPKGMTDTEFINKLIKASESYQDDKLYDPFPDAFGYYYNSNSYASGVIRKPGAVPPKLPGYQPGYGQPLPLP